jgi:hypothetical protein
MTASSRFHPPRLALAALETILGKGGVKLSRGAALAGADAAYAAS